MLFGYARVSSADQNLDVQIDTLTRAGCDQIFQEKISGVVIDRPQLGKLRAVLRPGDTVVVTHLDRLGRDAMHMMQLVSDWAKQGIQFRSLDLGIDTKTLSGNLVLQVFAVLAEYNRNLIKEKQRAGQVLAKEQGKHMGRPPGVDEENYQKVKMAYQKKLSINETVALTGVSLSSVKRYRKIIESGEV
ncbi:recombinase family protein [Spirosoma rhododendri]|uniref:Recombinase family protein n=1 Tax=Spirosoma rhododendri TaxID=2728024 RepID=A0A7L5DQ27_9BACT|nr:recombinase family protein [Spirosoma rhododendri]QJD79581.1 recombinase family protein [Spirosoma rhododendri]